MSEFSKLNQGESPKWGEGPYDFDVLKEIQQADDNTAEEKHLDAESDAADSAEATRKSELDQAVASLSKQIEATKQRRQERLSQEQERRAQKLMRKEKFLDMLEDSARVGFVVLVAAGTLFLTRSRTKESRIGRNYETITASTVTFRDEPNIREDYYIPDQADGDNRIGRITGDIKIDWDGEVLVVGNENEPNGRSFGFDGEKLAEKLTEEDYITEETATGIEKDPDGTVWVKEGGEGSRRVLIKE